MARVRIVEKDPLLPHQISLRFKAGQNHITQVFCNCQPEPLGEVPTGSDVMAIYMRRSLHSEHRAPFEHKPKWKVYEA